MNSPISAGLTVKFNPRLRTSVLAGVMALALGPPALASDPLPNDSVAIPVNVSFAVINNEFLNTGAYGPVRGGVLHDTHVSYDVTVLRYIRAFEIDGVECGVQAVLPYIAFLGQQKAAGARLSASSGFAQPYLGVFFWPINNPATGTYLVVAPWISPPSGSFNRNSALNPTAGAPGDAWFEEIEAGLRRVIIGTPATRNLALEGWSTTYFYQSNTHYRVTTPFGNTDATYREQPTEEIRGYAIYTFDPAIYGIVALGFYQSLGGKQTVNIPIPAELGSNPIADTGSRNQESQLRVAGSMFVSPTVQVMAYGDYDVAAHGGFLARTLSIRLTKIF